MAKRGLFVLLIAAAMTFGHTARAAYLELTSFDTSLPGQTVISVPVGFNPVGLPSGLISVSDGDPIWIFEGPSVNGLALFDGPANLKIEYYGHESSNDNIFNFGGETLFSTASTTVGSPAATVTRLASTDLMDFFFETNPPGGDSARNGGSYDSNLAIAFARLGDGSVLVLFEDGGGRDFDDMVVRISALPLPAAAWLLISAILGLISVSRIRRATA